MCTHDNRAVGLEHGHAHDDDHEAWTRRDFLVRSGLAAAGASVLFGGSPAQAFAASAQRHPGLVGMLGSLETDRVLVMVQLSGGNDGLNTVVPVTNDLYYSNRQGIAIARAATTPLGDDFGFHPAMAPLQQMWGAGHLGIVHSAGYNDQSLSHFYGIDVWATARDEIGQTGWTAEAAALLRTQPTAAPPAVQVAAPYPLFSQGPGDDPDGPMTLSRPEHLDRIVETGGVYDTDLPATAAGAELAYIRQVTNDVSTYTTAMQEAASGTRNDAEYPDSQFGRSLAAVARLIKGRLNTRVYLVRLGSFDTHFDQLSRHEALLDTLARSLTAFYEDLGADGDRTLTMTFSEFGRRVAQNGSAGTDHGTAAPMFVLGPAVAGGFYGEAPDLANLDGAGNLTASTDFRSVYGSVLQSWLGLGAQDTQRILGGLYPALDLIDASSQAQPNSPADGAMALTLALAAPVPNPVHGRAVIRFALPNASPVELELFDVMGRHVTTLADGHRGAGEHRVRLEGYGLAAGTYVLRLQSQDGAVTRTFTVVR